jgi:hypothetical protein
MLLLVLIKDGFDILKRLRRDLGIKFKLAAGDLCSGELDIKAGNINFIAPIKL